VKKHQRLKFPLKTVVFNALTILFCLAAATFYWFVQQHSLMTFFYTGLAGFMVLTLGSLLSGWHQYIASCKALEDVLKMEQVQ